MPFRLFRARNKRNYSERVIIPSAFRGSMESMADVAGFVLYDSE